tara:strand:- start:516 stop:659 length:144 start_codon:yes stop_codon:yes gene_type:complete
MTIVTQKDKRDYYSEQDKPKQLEIMIIIWADGTATTEINGQIQTIKL